jgi:hypothetical protein
MALANPNPISVNGNGLWLTSFRLTRVSLVVTAMPWDASTNRLAGNPSDARRLAIMLGKDAAAKGQAGDLFAAIATAAGAKAEQVRFINVLSPDPTQPVPLEAGIADGRKAPYEIDDLFAVLAANQSLAAAYGAAFAFVGSRIGG